MKLPKPINFIANELTVYCSSIRSNEFLPWLHYSFKNHSEIYWNSNLKFEFHEIQIISDKSNYVLDYQKKKKSVWASELIVQSYLEQCHCGNMSSKEQCH